ncbi:MAG: hypothetical protein FJY77_02900, partial [Candidatus Altiarchaeales archaeon]|nr:hypothetical protein [Candidatus Altiarchaeales archaeon]
MKILKALFGALLYLATFVVIPKMAVEKMPAEMMAQFGSQETLLSTLTTIGVLLAGLYAFKTLTPKSNPANLLSRTLLDFLELYVFLFFIGLGDATNLGLAEKQVMSAKATVLFNFRIFA